MDCWTGGGMFPAASCAEGPGRAGYGTVSRAVFRSERASFPREAERGTRDRTELHLGEAGSPGGRPGEAEVQARRASQAPATAPTAWHDAAYRRQPSPVVSG